jgi:late competence protein required for DNA uptake (superfamily II DNA/RNA helicase)
MLLICKKDTVLMECPRCKKEMRWQEGLLTDAGSRDGTVGKYYCLKCRVFGKAKEGRATRAGRKMAHGMVGVHVMDKEITKQGYATQIGILRERMHCATCGSYAGKPCKCTDCTCLYCREYKGK